MRERTTLSIWIDLTDEVERKLLDHVKSKGKRKCSRYLKKLIYDDLMQVQRQITTTTHYEEDDISIDVEAMKGFL